MDAMCPLDCGAFLLCSDHAPFPPLNEKDPFEQELAEQTAAGLKDDQGQDNLKGA